TSTSAPKTCTGVWDFIETNCQLTWYGITLYGAIDAGFGYQTHGAPLDPRSPPGAHTSSREQTGRRGGSLHLTGCKIHSLASRGLSRSAGTPLEALPWRPASVLVR